MSQTPDKPVAAYTLALIGVAFQAIGAFYAVFLASFAAAMPFGGPGMMGPWMMGPWMMGGTWMLGGWWAPFSVGFAAVVLVLGVLGVLWLGTGQLDRVRAGATLVLVVAVVAFPTMFGFMIGSLLMFVGSILGLTWQPMRRTVG
jgi:hypothetical protein